MIDREVTCCFTGHRPGKLPWGENESDPRCTELKARLFDTVEAVYLSGVRHFICGMAAGCDFYFCESVIRLRGERPGVTLEAAIPFEGQSARWAPEQRARYSALVSECDYETLLQSSYTADCMMRRNRYMVDSSSALIAVYAGAPGGTMNTVLYAMRQDLEILELPI